jgi:hypothetical protein
MNWDRHVRRAIELINENIRTRAKLYASEDIAQDLKHFSEGRERRLIGLRQPQEELKTMQQERKDYLEKWEEARKRILELRERRRKLQQDKEREFKELGLEQGDRLEKSQDSKRRRSNPQQENKECRKGSAGPGNEHTSMRREKPGRRAKTGDRKKREVQKNAGLELLVDPQVQSDRRDPPTDRPPDKPPPWKGASMGNLPERAGSRHASQLTTARGNTALRGKAELLEQIQNEVQTPSNQRHAIHADSSHRRAGGLDTARRHKFQLNDCRQSSRVVRQRLPRHHKVRGVRDLRGRVGFQKGSLARRRHRAVVR